MMPLPPGRLSTITGCLTMSVSSVAILRTAMSGPEPGTVATMILIGLVGKAPWPQAGSTAAAPEASSSSRRFSMERSSLVGDAGRDLVQRLAAIRRDDDGAADVDAVVAQAGVR